MSSILNSVGRLDRLGMVTRKMLSTSLNADPDVLDVLNTTGNENITYAEFVASELHLTFMPVELYYYDLSKNFASVLSPVLLGQYEEGIWHTSVGVFGQDLSSFFLISPGLCEGHALCIV